MLKRFNILLLFAFVHFGAYAQMDKVAMALEHFQDGSVLEAQKLIDEAITNEESSRDAYTWYARGFIYKEIYKQKERNNPSSALREESLNSFVKSIELDSEQEHTEANEGNLKFISNSYYNDAVTNLTPNGYPVAIKCFEKHKKVMGILKEESVVNARGVEFDLALASVYTTIYEKNRNENEEFFDKTKNLYAAILSIDPNHVNANYNMGILFYNKAVNIINELDYDTDIFVLMEVQENTVSIFKESLPFMEKAYQLDPNKKETLKGLEGIYFSLNEFDKSNEIKAKLESLDK